MITHLIKKNMDIRYFWKEYPILVRSNYHLIVNFFSAMIEPILIIAIIFMILIQFLDQVIILYLMIKKIDIGFINNGVFRNLLFFLNYKGLGFGYHKGNKWWGQEFLQVCK